MGKLKFILVRVLPSLIGLGFLALLMNMATDWAQLKSALANVDVSFLLITVACSSATIIVSTYRWQLLLNVFNVGLSFARLLRLILESTFFNLVVPGGVAGDVARTLHTRSEASLSKAASAVLTDRLMGLLGFVALSCVSLLFLWNELRAHSLAIPILAVGAVFVACMALIYSRRSMAALSGILKTLPFVGRIFSSLTNALGHYRGDIGLLFAAFFATLVAHSFQILSTWFIVLSLGGDISFFAVVLTVPLVALLAAIPITHFGIGIREGGFVLLFGLFNVDATTAILVSVLFSIVAIIIPALIGLALLALRMITDFLIVEGTQ